MSWKGVTVMDHRACFISEYLNGYFSFKELCGQFEVSRSKHNTRLRRIYSAPVDKALGLQADQRVLLVGYKSRLAYPDSLRRVKYHDADRDKRLVFLTNNFLIPAKTIADIHRSRWQVELFFKGIKQHLRIKTFFGTSPNMERRGTIRKLSLSKEKELPETGNSSN